jgi:peptidoglycan hydrolase CwlO-like protein
MIFNSFLNKYVIVFNNKTNTYDFYIENNAKYMGSFENIKKGIFYFDSIDFITYLNKNKNNLLKQIDDIDLKIKEIQNKISQII